MITFWAIVYDRSLVDGEWGRIYGNGIRSWQQLTPAPEVIIFGQECHRAECDVLGIRYIEAPCDADGLPLVNKCLALVEQYASHAVKCYLCPDLILDQDFVSAANYCNHWLRGWLAIGRRYTVAIPEVVDYANGGLAAAQRVAKEQGEMEHGGVVSYLMYTHYIWQDMPDFRCNHGVYDNYMVWYALAVGLPVIDITGLAIVVHQEHPEHFDFDKDGTNKVNYELKPKEMFFAGAQSASFITHCKMLYPTFTINDDYAWIGQFDHFMQIQDENGNRGHGLMITQR